ncbi:MAG: CBS domain-containing protein, partial [Methylococcaceae bacterium]|nr:CBS domain-containing protein [Methylococcaceae bacterium]
MLGDKVEEMAREFNKPSQPITRGKDSTDRAENYMYSPVSTALGDETVAQVKRRLSGQTAAFNSVELLFVIDADHRLQGVVSLSKLLAATPKMAINELMNSNITSVTLADHPEQVAEVALTHQIPAVPVVDDQGCLLGAVPAHTVFKLMREDHILDMERMVGIWRNSDQALSAIEGDPLRRVIDRLPWLIVG